MQQGEDDEVLNRGRLMSMLDRLNQRDGRGMVLLVGVVGGYRPKPVVNAGSLNISNVAETDRQNYLLEVAVKQT